MGRVSVYHYSKEIKSEADEHCNRFQIETSHDGFHIHYRNLRIRLSKEEMKMWKEAFKIAQEKIKNQNLL